MAEETGIVPKALLNRPKLDSRWTFSKEVFDELSGSRRYTPNGPANIPISEYDRYAAGYGLKGQMWIDTWEDISTIDSIWLSELSKREAAKKGTK